MKLSEFKNKLNEVKSLTFMLTNGDVVPVHFHVTEIGQITKNFIDCGGTIRTEKKVNFQLWEANDYDHRLAPQKLYNIITLSESKLGLEDAEIEVEYQTNTIGKFGIEFSNGNFILTNTKTNCLATDNCGIPEEKLKMKLSDLQTKATSCCTPGGGCC